MLRALLLGLSVLLAAASAGSAEERILRFVSDVAVERNGDLDVTETIRITVEGDQIRHGILRDFPTIYTDMRGDIVRVGFDVLQVTRDGRPEPYQMEAIGNGERIRIGSADVDVPPGVHDYVIHYRTTRQIGYFGDFDELYWNATGNGWTFPIDVAEARITLPDPVPFGNVAVYTGPQGGAAHDAEVIERAPGRIVFRTTAPLAEGSGLTVAASWQKGVVDAPGFERRALWWIGDNLGSIAAILSSAVALAFFAHAWRKVGRDPPRGPLVPLFSPPENLSAAATRYIAQMAFDNRVFSAAILDLAVRGHLLLADSGSTLVISKRAGGKPVDAAEAALAEGLFGASPEVQLVQKNHAVLGSARNALSRELARAHAGTIFHWNAGWLAIGIFVVLLAYAVTIGGIVLAMGADRGGTACIGILFASVAGIVVGVALNSGHTGRPLLMRLFGWLFMGLFALVFGIVGIAAFVTTLRGPLDAAPLLLPLVVLPVLVSAFSWMRSPTAEGQKLRDGIAGFRHYLGVAEENRLEVLHPPEKTPELFERYLPYAVALDVENAWAARFAGILAGASASAAVAHWYSTSANRDIGGLANRLGSSLTQTVAAASSAPGSRSGSGGGGSSGGGGGGGGGSGW